MTLSSQLRQLFHYMSICIREEKGMYEQNARARYREKRNIHGSASFIASVGSALLWRRLESFSACVSCKSILLVTLFLRPLSERKLKRPELFLWCCSEWETAC